MHIFCEANRVANSLARFARDRMEDFVSFDLPPPNVAQAILYDQLENYQVREVEQCISNDTDPCMSQFL